MQGTLCVCERAGARELFMDTLTNVNTPTMGGFAPVLSSGTKDAGVTVSVVPTPPQRWFVFRATYGREAKARDIIDQEGLRTYLPMRREKVCTDGGTKNVRKPLIPNLLFAYCTLMHAEHLVKGHPELPKFLRYYYNHLVLNPDGSNPPLTVPEREMDNFIRLTSVDNEHIKVVNLTECRFRSGDRVRVTQGAFEGVEGRVARIAGQQRVVIILDGLCAIATAYIPTNFLTKC